MKVTLSLTSEPTYPQMTTPEVMIEPLAYLATEQMNFTICGQQQGQRLLLMNSGSVAEETLKKHVNL